MSGEDNDNGEAARRALLEMVDWKDSGKQHISIKVDMDLVPEWSRVVEKVMNYYGVEATFVPGPDHILVEGYVPKEKVEEMAIELKKYWNGFVEWRKGLNRWETKD